MKGRAERELDEGLITHRLSVLNVEKGSYLSCDVHNLEYIIGAV